jgi:hypothetical protein
MNSPEPLSVILAIATLAFAIWLLRHRLAMRKALLLATILLTMSACAELLVALHITHQVVKRWPSPTPVPPPTSK